jgi:hypothetical protein
MVEGWCTEEDEGEELSQWFTKNQDEPVLALTA